MLPQFHHPFHQWLQNMQMPSYEGYIPISGNPGYSPSPGTSALGSSRRCQIIPVKLKAVLQEVSQVRIVRRVKPFTKKRSIVVLSIGSDIDSWSIFEISHDERHLSSLAPALCSGQSLPLTRRKNDGACPHGCKPIRRFKVRLANAGSAKKPGDAVQACNRHFLLCNFRLH
jgi:hypothetical protein